MTKTAQGSTLDVIRARHARGRGTPHDDGARVALVVEGGAMRGVVSAGMVSALEDLDIAHTLDAVYGSSAGAINAAYFVAGQARLGTRIYSEDINNRAFIDWRRALRGDPIVDLAFLLDDIARRRKALDVDRVLGASARLSVLATDVANERAHAFRDFADAADLFGALRASSTMPVIAGGPYGYGTGRWLDASLSEPIPVPTAERDGCTHLLVLLTRSGPMRPQASAFDRWFVAPRLRRVSTTLALSYLARATPYEALLRQIDAGRGPAGRARVLAIRAPGVHISKLERRAEVLQAGASAGYDAVMAAWTGLVPPATQPSGRFVR